MPSLYYNSANPRNTAYTIRGLGSNTLSISAANDGIEPGVGFYVDQVYHGRPATAAFDFTDIERVEVLRGPQGTLFGKNTTAGAIHIISRAPTFEPEANAEVSFGDYDFMQAKGAVSGPLFGDVVAGRLSAQLTQRDGVLHNVRTGEDLNELDNYAVRGQLLFVPTDNLKLRLIADVSDLDSACCTQSFLRVGQSLRSPARQFPALAAGLGYAPPSRDVYDRLTDIDADLHVDTQDGGVSADRRLGPRADDADLGHGLALLGLGRRERSRLHRHPDPDGPAHPLAPGSVQPGAAPRLERRWAAQLRRRALLLHAGDLRHADQHLRAGSRVLAAQPGEFHGADPAQPARRLRADGQLATSRWTATRPSAR